MTEEDSAGDREAQRRAELKRAVLREARVLARILIAAALGSVTADARVLRERAGGRDREMNSGQILLGHPSMGAWVSYGLGSGNPNLPPFVVMDDPRGGPFSGPVNWSSGYMPTKYQGTLFRSGGDPILDLRSEPTGDGRSEMSRAMQRAEIDLIRQLDVIHDEGRGHSELEARRARATSSPSTCNRARARLSI